ncbi:MAG: DUF2284 domain-containing protein [Candidatus Omnitrophota bacterium]
MSTANQHQLENIFEKFRTDALTRGCQGFKIFSPQEIVVAQWVRMKCMFGCGEYGKNPCCPPNVPSIAECERFFREYTTAAVFHFKWSVDKPEDRFPWTKKVNLQLLKLEREIFLSGYERTFLMFLDSCRLCDDCAGTKENCKQPRNARPGPDALGMDVYSTVRKLGYQVEVRTDYTQEMDRFAFLMIE